MLRRQHQGVLWVLPLFAGAFALGCSGGPAANEYHSASIYQDPPSDPRNQPPPSGPHNGIWGAMSLACSGTYTCGDSTGTLVSTAGTCTATVAGNAVTVNSDGTWLAYPGKGGTWAADANGKLTQICDDTGCVDCK